MLSGPHPKSAQHNSWNHISEQACGSSSPWVKKAGSKERCYSTRGAGGRAETGTPDRFQYVTFKCAIFI